MRDRALWPIVIGVAALASIGLWLSYAPRDQLASEHDRVAEHEYALEDEHAAVPNEPLERASVDVATSLAEPARVMLAEPAAAPEARVVAPQSPEVVGPGPHDPHEPGMVPHPMDAAHKRINAENQLIQALNDAMSFHKVKEMREMLVEYRELDPDDVEAHQLGYEVIADCIEFPGDASLTAARAFYDTQRHSPLRRFVRRICFENSN